jgi:copper chaperone CopZ
MTKKYKVLGMDCPSCATMLECDLEDVGIKCKCSYSNETLEVEETHDFDKIKGIVEKSGYSIK